jgi:hypothetical protein
MLTAGIQYKKSSHQRKNAVSNSPVKQNNHIPSANGRITAAANLELNDCQHF